MEKYEEIEEYYESDAWAFSACGDQQKNFVMRNI